MHLIIGLVFVLGLSAAFAAVASVTLYRFASGLSRRRRQWLAAVIGPAMVLVPAFIAVADGEGLVALASLLVFNGLLALVAGYPAVRLVEPRPATD